MTEHPRKILRKRLDPLPKETRDWRRASGLCLCEICGFQYYDHPLDPEILCNEGHKFMNVLCNGDRVKL